MIPRPLVIVFALLVGNVPLAAQTAATQDISPARDYVHVREGHLHLGEKRIRFWGTTGTFPGKSHAENEALTKRLRALGFNMVRYWPGFVEKGEYKSGDGSRADLADHLLTALKKEGIYVWCAGLNELGIAMPQDGRIIKDESLTEWSKAVGDRGMRLRNNLARAWDKRLEALAISRMKNVAEHKNMHNGLKWADDNVFAVWELSDEEEWFGRMIRGQFQKLPQFFQHELLMQWNDFLRKKYQGEEKLREAWVGLLPRESLVDGTVLLLPIGEATELQHQRLVLGLEAPGDKRKYSTTDFSGKRGSDVIEFLLELWVRHKQAEHDALKPLGRSLTRSPLVWDTGSDYEIQNQYLQQHGDAIAHGTYVTGFHHDPTHKRFPWRSALEEQPRIGWDRPRLEHNRFEGKPFFCHETQIEQPAKYRAEFPLRVAALGAIQDWDIVIFSSFGSAPEVRKDDAEEQPMDYTQGANAQGRQFGSDEVLQSAMRAAGEVFKQGLLRPAANPTRFVFGKSSLFHVRTMEPARAYGEAGAMFVPTTYRYGSRLSIDVSREDDEIVGPVYRARAGEPNPVRPTAEIAYDWSAGTLKIDGMGVAAFAGFFDDVAIRFDNGLVLKHVRVANPEGMPYPVAEDEKYLTFTLVTLDGEPLEKTRCAVVSLVSTSFNTGFRLDHSKLRREASWGANPGAIVDRGKTPVLVARVGAKIAAKEMEGMRYRILNWRMETIGEGAIEGEALDFPADKAVFLIELMR